MRRLAIWPIFLLIALILTACGGAQATQTAPAALPTQPAMTFTPTKKAFSPPTVVLPTATPGPKAADINTFIISDPAQVANTGRPQVVEFFAQSNDDCKQMRPIMHSLQDQYASMVDFIYLDIDADNTKALQKKFAFNGLRPTIVFLDAEGKEKGRLIGVAPKEKVENQIEELLTVG